MTPTETAQPQSRDERFVAQLTALLQDPGALAALRRGLGKPPGEAPEMHPYVLPWLSGDEPNRYEDAFYLLATLFAYWHQGKTEPAVGPPRNLGASLAQLHEESDSIEKRFVALLNCHIDDLQHHLRHAVGLLKGRDVAIDWNQLLRDIRAWDWDSRTVQRAWARSFWKGSAIEAAVDEVPPFSESPA